LLLVKSLEMGGRHNGAHSCRFGSGNGIVGDLEWVGGGRHAHHIAIVGPNAYLWSQDAEDFNGPRTERFREWLEPVARQ